MWPCLIGSVHARGLSRWRRRQRGRCVGERSTTELAELRGAVGDAPTAAARARGFLRRFLCEVDDAHRRNSRRTNAGRGHRSWGWMGHREGCSRRRNSTSCRRRRVACCRHGLERAAARRAVAKVRTVDGVADLAAPLPASGVTRGVRLTLLLLERSTERCRDARRERRCGRGRRGRTVRILSTETNRRSRRRNARPKALSALLAKGQVRRVLASARRARHDVVLPAEITFPVGDNTETRPSSADSRQGRRIGSASVTTASRCSSTRSSPNSCAIPPSRGVPAVSVNELK